MAIIRHAILKDSNKSMHTQTAIGVIGHMFITNAFAKTPRPQLPTVTTNVVTTNKNGGRSEL